MHAGGALAESIVRAGPTALHVTEIVAEATLRPYLVYEIDAAPALPPPAPAPELGAPPDAAPAAPDDAGAAR